jgi:hypothetical protein
MITLAGFHYIKTKQTYNQTNKQQTNTQKNKQETKQKINKLLNDDEKSRSLSSTVKPVSPPTLIIH